MNGTVSEGVNWRQWPALFFKAGTGGGREMDISLWAKILRFFIHKGRNHLIQQHIFNFHFVLPFMPDTGQSPSMVWEWMKIKRQDIWSWSKKVHNLVGTN